MVWYGMVWYGMVWYGMVWYGMVWYEHNDPRSMAPGIRLLLGLRTRYPINRYMYFAMMVTLFRFVNSRPFRSSFRNMKAYRPEPRPLPATVSTYLGWKARLAPNGVAEASATLKLPEQKTESRKVSKHLKQESSKKS